MISRRGGGGRVPTGSGYPTKSGRQTDTEGDGMRGINLSTQINQI